MSSLVPLEGRNEVALPKAEQKAANETPAVPVAAAPPPPPPPSPPPAPAASEQYAGQASTQDMVVTGSRIRSPSLSSESDPRAAKSTAGAASPLSVIDPFGDFLSRLQADLKENNRRAVIGNVGFPLKVRESGHTRVYHSAEAVQQDFDRIFTAQVKVAILTQRAGRLTSRDAGRLMGNGKIWFGRTCPNKACSPAGPVRIREVNP